MKIGTDGVLLGSLAAAYPARKVLDIGTGCGLIALMIAQESPADIVALEPEEAAVATALKNVLESPWAGRIRVIRSRFQEFVRESKELFDLVVCNPPYFRNSLLSPDQKRNLARHADTLPAEALFEGVSRIISQEGVFLLIIPFEQESATEKMALLQGLHCLRKLRIRTNPGQNPKRTILAFSPIPGDPSAEEITIEAGLRHCYTEAYKTLTGKYYLNF